MQENNDRREDKTPAENSGSPAQATQKRTFRIFMWFVCAAYLIYLSVKMLGDVRSGAATGSSRTLCIVASIVFCGVSVYLIISAARSAIRAFRETADAIRESDAKDAEEALAARHEEKDEDEGYGYVALEDDGEPAPEETPEETASEEPVPEEPEKKDE